MRASYSLHNPFINRFNEPVTRRRDEMQCDEYMAWLRERNLGISARRTARTTVATASAHLGRMIAGFCGLLVLLISIAAFVRAL
ncbi:MAG TPA: hypothetical protein VIX17_24515 [Pyrinomonadaceae bacterium]|jgi:hypothetical protein